MGVRHSETFAGTEGELDGAFADFHGHINAVFVDLSEAWHGLAFDEISRVVSVLEAVESNSEELAGGFRRFRSVADTAGTIESRLDVLGRGARALVDSKLGLLAADMNEDFGVLQRTIESTNSATEGVRDYCTNALDQLNLFETSPNSQRVPEGCMSELCLYALPRSKTVYREVLFPLSFPHLNDLKRGRAITAPGLFQDYTPQTTISFMHENADFFLMSLHASGVRKKQGGASVFALMTASGAVVQLFLLNRPNGQRFVGSAKGLEAVSHFVTPFAIWQPCHMDIRALLCLHSYSALQLLWC